MTKVEFIEWCKIKPFIINEKYIKNHFPEIYVVIISFAEYPECFIFKQKLYHYINDDTELKLGICPDCGNRCNFIDINKGYHEYCSRKCADKSNKKKDKFRKSCLEKYGTEYPLQSKLVQSKMKQTCLENFRLKPMILNINHQIHV